MNQRLPRRNSRTRGRRWRARCLHLLAAVVLLAVAGAAAAGVLAFHHYGRDLPDHAMLADYRPPVATRFYAGDGRLMAEFAVESRVFVPIAAIPKRVRQAFIAAEDQNFHRHFGIDVAGILRAAFSNLRAVGDDRRLQGASTITQQVAKNFLLTNEVSFERKIREAILGHAHRAGAEQGPHSRALSQRDLSRLRVLWSRGRRRWPISTRPSTS